MMPVIGKNASNPAELIAMEEVAVVPDFMLVYKEMKFKMKLTYESYMKNVKVGRLLNIAIYKTRKLLQYLQTSSMLLRRFIDDSLGIWLYHPDPVTDNANWEQFQQAVNENGLTGIHLQVSDS